MKLPDIESMSLQQLVALRAQIEQHLARRDECGKVTFWSDPIARAAATAKKLKPFRRRSRR